ncbi:D-isomer specific 2-hydroxyacid dehydrogenase family protein [Aspergillus foveolatus]|uniref:D-isomer specific 2-hydroxyacid dehydrogenase family protein n=1 Tax=Aspergillus foveolatus TaxID=210207 RepID=UPI003CCD82C8
MPLPSAEHHHIVFLQGSVLEIPKFELPAPFTYSQTVYDWTSSAEVPDRIRDASIIILSAARVDAAALSRDVSPHLKLIVMVASGFDCIDLEACRKRGIVVCNCPNSNIEAVSEHAIGMYFAARRRLLDMHMSTRAGKWKERGLLMFDYLDKDGIPPLTCQDEVAGIIGNGSVGKRIATLARNLGMKVLVSDRKASTTPDPTRVPFETVIKQSTVLFIAVPLMESTRNFISNPEFENMSSHAIVVNVSRGGTVDEEALVHALRERKISGAATDVFNGEPAGPDTSPLLAEDAKDLNIIATPHLAWLSQRTSVNYGSKLKLAVEAWAVGQPVNVVS